MKSLTHLAVACSLAATLGTAVSTASAQEWPRQPVKLLVGSAPGGGTDAGRKAHEQADGAGPPGPGRQRGSDGGGTDQPVAAGKGHHGLRTGDGRLGGSPARSR